MRQVRDGLILVVLIAAAAIGLYLLVVRLVVPTEVAAAATAALVAWFVWWIWRTS